MGAGLLFTLALTLALPSPNLTQVSEADWTSSGVVEDVGLASIAMYVAADPSPAIEKED